MGYFTLAFVIAGVLLIGASARKAMRRTTPLPSQPPVATEDVEDAENPACGPTNFRWTDNAYVEVILDSAASDAKRLLVTVVRDSAQPLRARLQASVGAVECQADSSGLQFRVRDSQSYLAVVVHSPTERAVINVRLTSKGRWLKSGTYAASDGQQEAVWVEGMESIVDEAARTRDRDNAQKREERAKAIEQARVERAKRFEEFKARTKRP